MPAILSVPLLLLGLSGCASPEDTTFGGGGAGLDGDGGGDGGDSGGGVDDGVSPEITAVTAEFYSPPNYDTVIQVYIYWSDAQADIDGGKVVYDIQGSDGEALSGTLDITGTEARLDDDIDGDPVYFWVSGIDTSLTYEVEVTLKDSAGHSSQAASASIQ